MSFLPYYVFTVLDSTQLDSALSGTMLKLILFADMQKFKKLFGHLNK